MLQMQSKALYHLIIEETFTDFDLGASLSAIMKMQGIVDGGSSLMEGVEVLTTPTGLLKFTGNASVVVRLSNYTEKSCVRCITVACYATYGIEGGTR